VDDSQATACQNCKAEFSVAKRRVSLLNRHLKSAHACRNGTVHVFSLSLYSITAETVVEYFVTTVPIIRYNYLAQQNLSECVTHVIIMYWACHHDSIG